MDSFAGRLTCFVYDELPRNFLPHRAERGSKYCDNVQAIDPATGLPPALPSAGFLPVNDTLGRGQGFVTFHVFPKSTVATGDTATAKAEIVFDINDPIPTNTWKNTLDALPPTSAIASNLPSSLATGKAMSKTRQALKRRKIRKKTGLRFSPIPPMKR
ncbi:MAG: hypothetical protein AAB316_02680 [Bacteroidota bacterium]